MLEMKLGRREHHCRVGFDPFDEADQIIAAKRVGGEPQADRLKVLLVRVAQTDDPRAWIARKGLEVERRDPSAADDQHSHLGWLRGNRGRIGRHDGILSAPPWRVMARRRDSRRDAVAARCPPAGMSPPPARCEVSAGRRVEVDQCPVDVATGGFDPHVLPEPQDRSLPLGDQAGQAPVAGLNTDVVQ